MRKWSDYCNYGIIPKELTKELPIVSIYGGYQVGKSTLLNCLLGRYISLAGKGLATTALASRYRYGEYNQLCYRTKPDSPYEGDLKETTLEEIRNRDFINNVDLKSGFHLEAKTPVDLLKLCDIVDTPGYNASEQDNTTALNAMKHIHYVLFVVPNRGLSQPEKELLLQLQQNKIPVSILMNCSCGRREERWIPENEINEDYVRECESWLSSMNINPVPIAGKKVYLCNFLFYWSQMQEFSLSIPDIDHPDTVQKHIVSVLREEGYSTDKDTILKLSGVYEILKEIEHQVNGYDALTHRIGVEKYEPIL